MSYAHTICFSILDNAYILLFENAFHSLVSFVDV